MTRRNTNHNRNHSNGVVNGLPEQNTARVDVPSSNKNKTRQQLSLYISSSPPQSRRKHSPRQNLASPIRATSPTTEVPAGDDDVHATNGNGVHISDEEEEQSEDVDDDNICLICVAKCTCGKTEKKPIRTKEESPLSPVEPHFLRHRIKLRLSSPTPNSTSLSSKRRGRPPKVRSPEVTLVKTETNGHSYGTRSHDIIVRDGRGRGKSSGQRRPSEAQSDITMEDISDINLDEESAEEEQEQDDDESEDDDDSDAMDDLGDDVDIEEEEERAIIAEESRRLRQYSAEDDDADEEDDELEDEEDLFQERQYSSSESSPDEDHEFYQNDLYLDSAFCNVETKSSPRRNSYDSDAVVYENPILKALIEDHKESGQTWADGYQDRVGWECFIDDTDVDIGEDWMHLDDESTRFGGGDTTDEEDFKLLAPPVPPKKKGKKKPNNDVVADVITTAHQPPPLATWERDGAEITIIDALPQAESPIPSPVRIPQSPPPETPALPSLDEFFDASLLSLSPDSDSDSVSSSYTVTRTQTPLSRKDSTATTTSFTTDTFITPANRGRSRKVPMGSYRRKVMLGERSLEAREKSVFLKEWYTLQERRNLREFSKARRNLEFVEMSPGRGRRREKLRTARRARKEHDKSAAELDMQFIKRRRTSDVQGSGSSAAALMESLGIDLTEDMSEDEYDEDEFEGGAIMNGVGERMVLDDDLELAQFIVPPLGGIDLSPLFGAVDA